VIQWSAARLAAAADARLLRGESASGPLRVTIDSRAVGPGDLFVGLPGANVDGGAYAEQALRAGAWGVMVGPAYGAAATRVAAPAAPAQVEAPAAAAQVEAPAAAAQVEAPAGGVVLEHADPLAGLQALAHAWRGELGARVVAVTGSTGKTSTKDILAALLGLQLRTVASPANLNTEIGLPLAVLAAPAGTEALVLELAMRGPGQIAELAAIAEPDVGVIVNIGPVHLGLLGSLEAIAAAKAELIAALAPGAAVVVPAGEPLLAPHLRADLRTLTFGEGGDVELLRRRPDGEVTIRDRTAAGSADGAAAGGDDRTAAGGDGGERMVVLRPSFAQSHNLRNLLAAVAAARALGVTPSGRLEVAFSALRGERVALADGIVLINDCYNANPMSMRAALDDLADTAPARRVAVLGDMLELGPQEQRLHRELAADAARRGVELLVAVGPLAGGMGETFAGEIHCVPDASAAAELLPGLLRPRDTVLVKGSRGVGLERVAETLAGAR
jgi:UDP-N-acetylmuramoyl-tripeptide--D-alanyl-D-alanine ligase